MKTVSIIIPCYNQSQWLTDAVVSCIEQTIKPHEIIIVNDGSTDGTVQVANSLIMQYPDFNIKLITKENGGLSSARNAGIKASTGEYFLPLDADDKIAPTMLEKCLEADDDIVSTYVQEFGDSNLVWIPPHLHPKKEDFLKYNCITCCSLFKREIFDKIGGYDENMKLGYEDHDFNIRALIEGYTVTVIPEFLFYYRKHGNSLISTAHKNHKLIREYMMSKY